MWHESKLKFMNHDRYKDNSPWGHVEHIEFDPEGNVIREINEHDMEDTLEQGLEIAKKAEHHQDEVPE